MDCSLLRNEILDFLENRAQLGPPINKYENLEQIVDSIFDWMEGRKLAIWPQLIQVTIEDHDFSNEDMDHIMDGLHRLGEHDKISAFFTDPTVKVTVIPSCDHRPRSQYADDTRVVVENSDESTQT